MDQREARREIKLNAHQIKGSKGRTVILGTLVRKKIDGYLKTQTAWRGDSPLIASQRQWAGVFDCKPVYAVQGDL